MNIHAALIVAAATTVFFPASLCAESGSVGNLPGASARIDLSDWRLVWEDDFDYPDEQLEVNWQSQNGPSSHILCSRWRENAVVEDGILHLVNKKEQRGGQDWTSGNVWTKKRFKYGYFECRYRYAEATGTNNSFWLMTQGPAPKEGKRFEIDINEGHYPYEINTNIHNWSDFFFREGGSRTHPTFHKSHTFGTRVDHSLPFEIPVVTDRLRFSSTTIPHVHIRELRIYAPSKKYPNPLSESADGTNSIWLNHAMDDDVVVTSSASHRGRTTVKKAVDGSLRTSWVARRSGEYKWIEFHWPKPIAIGCIQIVTGWKKDGVWTELGQLTDCRIQAAQGQALSAIAEMDAKETTDFGANFHTYGLHWNKDELIFYHDRTELRRVPNEFCYSECPIFLSEAIIDWGGVVSEEIDGTSMKVDWVRYYQK